MDRNATLYTDGFYSYGGLNYLFDRHITIIGTKKGCGQDGSIHVNTAENFISTLKRGHVGVYQHISKQHLHRYLNEFDFRHSLRKIDDKNRTVEAIRGIAGKRLLYRESVNC